jgi:lipoate-protein ligase A
VGHNLLKGADKRGPDRVLVTHLAFDRSPERDLAFEAHLLMSEGARAALFVYVWSTPVLVMGKGQAGDDVRRDICAAEGIPVLRRASGGTAVLHTRTLNIGLVLPAEHEWSKSVRGLYGRFVPLVSDALGRHGVTAHPFDGRLEARPARTAICFEAHTEDSLLLGGRKVFGCAQRRLKGAVLVHGTLLLSLDVPLSSRVFGVPAPRIERAMTALPEGVDRRGLTEDIVAVTAAGMGLAPEIAANRGYDD